MMENTNKKTEQLLDKKEHTLRDRGDESKRVTKDKNNEKKKTTKDRGDTEEISRSDKKIKTEDCRNSKDIKGDENATAKDKGKTTSNKHIKNNAESNKIVQKKNEKVVEDIRMKIITDKYSLGSKKSQTIKKEDEKNDGPLKNLTKDTQLSKGSDSSSKTTAKKAREMEAKVKYRKPMIKTITAKNETTKTYKAVTFVDQKQQMPLKINIPSNHTKFKDKHIDERVYDKTLSVASKISIKEKDQKRDKVKIKKKPIFKAFDRKRSPQIVRQNSPTTEVAKWAPSSVNQHTKPYYEAWVNTTLAATSRDPQKDRFHFDREMMKTLQRVYDKSPTPEFVCKNLLDERYLGKIKVNYR